MMLTFPLELFVVVMITVFVFWHDSQVDKTNVKSKS